MKIEIVGLPGSGKTTLSKKLHKNGNSSSYLLSSSLKFEKNTDLDYFKNIFKVNNKIERIIKFTPPLINKYIIEYCKKKESISSLGDMLNEWGEFVNYFILNIDQFPRAYNKSCKDIFIDFIINYFIFNRNKEMDSISLIIDSGIIFKSTYLSDYFLEDKENMISKFKEYIRTCPFLPDKIIYLKILPKRSLERIKKRKVNFPIFLQNNTTEEMLDKLIERSFVLDNILKILKNKGINIIEFDDNIQEAEIYKKIVT